MFIECIRNEGFEDQLTASTAYKVKEFGENSYLIKNDNEEPRWYGQQHFSIQCKA